MAQFDITTSQFQASLQKIQNKYVRIELLNRSYQVVDNLEGVCIGGSITIDANSDMRRSGNIQLVVKDSSFEVQAGGRIFLDKYVRIYTGIYSFLENDIIYTNCGIFVIDAPNYTYDPSTHTLSLSLLDLMSELTGVRRGYLPGIPTKILANENIRNAIIDTLRLGGFTKYIVEDTGKVPVELNFDQGTTVYDILAGLRDIYPNYEIFFDANGVFHYEHIPTGENEPIQIDDALWQSIVLSESTDTDFQNVKNSIEVFGRVHDPAHYAEEAVYGNTGITLRIEDVTEYSDNVIYGFTLNNSIDISNPILKINDLPAYPLYEDEKPMTRFKAIAGEYLCVKWNETGKRWNYLGHLQAYAIAEDTNPDSPFYVDGSVGRIRLPLYGGDFDNIFSDNLALQRAKYELWARTQLQTTISLNCVPVEWLEVNTLVQYTRQGDIEPSLWIIKSVSYGLDNTSNMNVSLSRFYPNYFYI